MTTYSGPAMEARAPGCIGRTYFATPHATPAPPTSLLNCLWTPGNPFRSSSSPNGAAPRSLPGPWGGGRTAIGRPPDVVSVSIAARSNRMTPWLRTSVMTASPDTLSRKPPFPEAMLAIGRFDQAGRQISDPALPPTVATWIESALL